MARTNSRAAKEANKKVRTVKMLESPSTPSSSSSSLTRQQSINQMTPSSTIILIFASAVAVGNARRKALIATRSPSFEDIFTSQREETLFKEIFSNLNQTDITNTINSAKAISNETNSINCNNDINSPFDDNDGDVHVDDSQDTYNQTFNNEI